MIHPIEFYDKTNWLIGVCLICRLSSVSLQYHMRLALSFNFSCPAIMLYCFLIYERLLIAFVIIIIIVIKDKSTTTAGTISLWGSDVRTVKKSVWNRTRAFEKRCWRKMHGIWCRAHTATMHQNWVKWILLKENHRLKLYCWNYNILWASGIYIGFCFWGVS